MDGICCIDTHLSRFKIPRWRYESVEDHPEIRELEGYSDSTRITFRQLASHTAGLIREPKLEKADAGPIEEWENKVLQSIPNTSFEFKPGEKFGYSNIGYGILGVALSRAANAPFHSYGMGFELYQDPKIAIAGHAGSIWGYTSYFGFEKECQYGVILMRNYNWGMTSWDFGPKILLRKLLEFEKNKPGQM